MYQALTNNILIRVVPSFSPDIPSLYPNNNLERYTYDWIYNIKIENLGNAPIQLLKRHWKVYDSYGTLVELREDGVVGQKPTLNSLEVFEYSSKVRLFSTCGMMLGEYLMLNRASMEKFSVIIPAFPLSTDLQNCKFDN